jgi:hypothetical protein
MNNITANAVGNIVIKPVDIVTFTITLRSMCWNIGMGMK